MRFSGGADPYAPIARFYDAVVGPFLKPVREEVTRIAVRRHFRNLIDICCGTGSQCEMLARAGLAVTGVDLSPAMISVARTKGSGAVLYTEADASKLPFEDGSFDAALISLALHEKPPLLRGKIIREALRVLSGDGELLLVDYSSPDTPRARTGLAFMNVAEWFAGADHYANFRSYMESGAINSLLQENGLSKILSRQFHMDSIALVLTKAP